MNFGQALIAIQAGRRVRRAGWNGKGMSLYYKARFMIDGIEYEPCIVMITAQGRHQPGWLASQADMLATDWVDLEVV